VVTADAPKDPEAHRRRHRNSVIFALLEREAAIVFKG
jgi:hypothetical protein